ncbi:MAG TPA: DUF6056 family protein [Ignavibacteria bacterium]|nr:DUF6056 family protein [Ignavibacteria bacterium]HMR40021.1 DUF6056 family protein [Ignavibacteria bacterium]
MKNFLSNKFYGNTLLAFLLLMIIPFFVLFIYNHPSADDWGMAENTEIKGFVDTQIHYYKNWTGKYFSNAVMSYNPLYFNSLTGYKIVTFLLMVTFVITLYALFSRLTTSILSKKEKLIFTLSFMFMYLYAMPSLSQSFYWLTASVVYQVGIILIMLFAILYSKINDQEDTYKKNMLTFATAVCVASIAGCSEMSMVSGVLMISLLLVYEIITKKKIKGRLILFAVVCATGSLILITAPGNKVRGSLYPDSHKLIPSLITTASAFWDYLISWIFLSPLLFVTVLLIPLFVKIINADKAVMKGPAFDPKFAGISSLVILFILFFTPVWSLGRAPFSRTVNIIYLMFLAAWFYNVFVLCKYVYGRKENLKIKFEKVPGYVYLIPLIIMCLFLLKKNNVKNVYADLLLGNASKYNTELNERYKMIEKSTSDSLVLGEVEMQPRTIFFTDITSDPDLEFNKMYAHYFNKKSIAVLKKDTLKSEE